MKAYAATGRLIDTIDNTSGLTSVFAETLEQVRQRYPDAQVVDVDEWCAEKQRQQQTPITWQDTDEESYMEMLECVPPARMAGGAFLVGEPMDHLAATGESRFEMFRKRGPKYYVASRPVTIAEFDELIGARNEPAS